MFLFFEPPVVLVQTYSKGEFPLHVLHEHNHFNSQIPSANLSMSSLTPKGHSIYLGGELQSEFGFLILK
jgi:hypothetical protein